MNLYARSILFMTDKQIITQGSPQNLENHENLENDTTFSSHGNMEILNFEKYHGKMMASNWKGWWS